MRGRFVPARLKKTGSARLRIGRRSIDLSALGKKLFPRSKITKGEMIAYYERIAPTMAPYLKNRLLVLHRYPNGIAEEGFYQKDASLYFPEWIPRVAVKKREDGTTNYVVCNEAATLVYLANQGTITFHTWLSRIPKIDYPDKLVFDFDPPPRTPFSRISWAALECRKLLDSLGLPTFVMTTGSRGLHVVVPLKPQETFDAVKKFARNCAQVLIMRHPGKFTLEMRKVKRGRRILVDIFRNAFAQISVTPYSLRAKPGAPVATPIRWQELTRGSVSSSQRYTIKNIFRRLARTQDPWHDFRAQATTLTRARTQLAKLLKQEAEL